MPSTVYIETTIVSYLTAWPSRDVVRLSHQILTRKWWTDARPQFELYTSDFVMQEASKGDPTAAAARVAALQGIQLLTVSAPALALAGDIVRALSLPARAQLDAAHVAIAAVHGIEFLLTWNCRHLANAALTAKIERACAGSGCAAPRIVTPELLMEAP